MKRRIGQALKWIAIGLAVLLLIGLIYQTAASAADRQAHPMPGTQIDMGGYKLHLYCEGQGLPTVVLIAGAGDIWAIWQPVQSEIQQSTRVCSYDRPGLGWSDFYPGGGVLNVDQQSQILHTLLANAGEAGPYIVVGHSIGGVIARTFAANFPSETAGMVLVDSSVEGQFRALPPDILRANQSAGTIFTICRVLQPFGIVRLAGLGQAKANSFPLLSEEARTDIAASFNQTRGCTALMRDGATADEPLINGTLPDPLGDLPMIVLTRGLPENQLNPDVTYPADQVALFEQMQTIWLELQGTLLTLSSNSKQVIAAKSGHYIQTTEPELVIEAIRDLLRR